MGYTLNPFTGQFDATGSSGGGGGTSPGGANTQVQFNDSGSFNGDPGLTYNKTTKALVQGTANTASATNSSAFGNNTVASGIDSHSEGANVQALGVASHAEGLSNNPGSNGLAVGVASHVEGFNCIAGNDYSHAEGTASVTAGDNAHAEGHSTTAAGAASHSEGDTTLASGADSHSEGSHTQASGPHSHAEGLNTVAAHNQSHAAGLGTKTGRASQMVIGEYNIGHANTLFEVGYGSGVGTEKTAISITDAGKTVITDGTQGTSGYVWTSIDTAGTGSWLPSSGGGSGANTSLSNLVSVAFNTDIVPGVNNTYNIGSPSLRVASGYFQLLRDASDVFSVAPVSRSLWDAAGNQVVNWSATKSVALRNGTNLSFEGSSSGAVAVVAPTTVTNYTIKLPSIQGAASTFLQNDGSGNLSWTAAGFNSIATMSQSTGWGGGGAFYAVTFAAGSSSGADLTHVSDPNGDTVTVNTTGSYSIEMYGTKPNNSIDPMAASINDDGSTNSAETLPFANTAFMIQSFTTASAGNVGFLRAYQTANLTSGDIIRFPTGSAGAWQTVTNFNVTVKRIG